PKHEDGAVRAAFETPGVLNSLRFMPYEELLQPLPSGFIDVAVAAIGLNSRDLDHWSGRSDSNDLSSEYAGTVTAVDAEVRGLTVGDRVYGLGRGQFGNYTRVPAAFARKLGPGDDMIQMATMPMAYTTAVFAFDYDVGLASIRLAKAKGADVFALVETTEQARFVENEMAISASHVISAPSLKALQQAAQTTRNGGFDVIISTAQGELLHSSLQVLAPLGHFVDVAQVKLAADPMTGTQLLQKNAAYRSIDPFTIIDSDPGLGEGLMQTVDDYYCKGLIGPIGKVTAPDVAQLGPALGGFS
ncbi:MAG: hypothetical protein Q9198_009855, partial [Flavoplaca austrocitrina]